MGTMDQFDARIRPYKLALTEAFGLTAEQTSSQISVDRKAVNFRVVPRDGADFDALREGPLKQANINYEAGQFPSASFPASSWTEKQAAAAEDYMAQFPSFGDFPREVRDLLRSRSETDRP